MISTMDVPSDTNYHPLPDLPLEVWTEHIFSRLDHTSRFMANYTFFMLTIPLGEKNEDEILDNSTDIIQFFLECRIVTAKSVYEYATVKDNIKLFKWIKKFDNDVSYDPYYLIDVAKSNRGFIN